MDSRILDALYLKARRLFIKLVEFEDISRQLAEAVNRKDEVSVQMLLNMRAEPANQLEEIQQGLRQQVLDLPEEDAIRAREILEGGEAQDANEAALCGQVSQNRRLLLRCQETDKRISMGLDSRRSFYSKYR